MNVLAIVVRFNSCGAVWLSGKQNASASPLSRHAWVSLKCLHHANPRPLIVEPLGKSLKPRGNIQPIFPLKVWRVQSETPQQKATQSFPPI